VTKYRVSVNDPALPDGAEVEVPGLGVFVNGSTRQVSEEDAEYFRTVNSQLVDVETDDRPAWTGAAGVELRQGPTVLAAFKDHPTISVEKSGEPVGSSTGARARNTEDSKQESEPKKES
jgi:hypothetical protein